MGPRATPPRLAGAIATDCDDRPIVPRLIRPPPPLLLPCLATTLPPPGRPPTWFGCILRSITKADHSPSTTDMPCPQGTDSLSPLEAQLHHLRCAPSPLRAQHGSSPHSPQVRCDAASLGVPCTNCVAFQIECRIPTPKRKKVPGSSVGQSRDSDRYINPPRRIPFWHAPGW